MKLIPRTLSLQKSSFFALALAAATLLLTAAQTHAELIYGLTTGNALVSFDSATPGLTTAPVSISGVSGETIFDIDIRPADGLLYGFSSAGRLYSINPITGLATLNASLTGASLDPNATRFSIDFNPTVDRLRIVSNTGQDLRLTPSSGVTTIDTNLNGASTRAVSVAYTNNDTNPATGTTLFYIDTPGGAPRFTIPPIPMVV